MTSSATALAYFADDGPLHALHGGFERRMLGAPELRVGPEQVHGFAADDLDHLQVGEVRRLELRQAGLARAEVVAGAAQAQVRLRQREAVVVVLHELEAVLSRGGRV